MQQTSILAYTEVKPKLGQKQAEVLEAIEQIAPASNRMIARHLGWEINSVTPRVLELRVKGKVVQAYIGTERSGRKAIFWKPKGMKEFGL